MPVGSDRCCHRGFVFVSVVGVVIGKLRLALVAVEIVGDLSFTCSWSAQRQ